MLNINFVSPINAFIKGLNYYINFPSISIFNLIDLIKAYL